MPAPAQVSPAEWEVLDVLWNHSPATSQEVCAALEGRQDWHPKTIGTFLARLVRKGLVKAKREGKANLYSARRTREECVRVESDSFLRRVFRGATAPLLLHFVEQAELSAEEIREVERLLKQKKKSP